MHERVSSFVPFFRIEIMKLNFSIHKLYPQLLGIFMVLFFVAPKYTSLCIAAWAVFLIVGGIRKKVRFVFSKINLIWIGFYLLYAFGCFFTNHSDIAGRYLEYKLSFLIFPILFSFFPKERFSMAPIISWMVAGSIWLIGLGVWHGIQCGSARTCFLASELSYIHHPTYFSVFLLFTGSAVWYGYFQQYKGFVLGWMVPYSLILLAAQLFSLSLAGILFLLILFTVIGIVALRKRFSKKVMWAGMVVLPFLAYLFVTKTPQVEGEWTGAKFYANSFIQDPSAFVRGRQYPFSGTETRLVMWTASMQVLAENPLGVGTGNVDDFLGDKLRSLGQEELAKQNYNPHNQFFQTGIEIGWVSMIYLLGICVLLIVYGLKKHIWLLAVLAGSLMFNSLFESMLQRQSGIIFYTFWFCLLIAIQSIEKRQLQKK